MVKDVRVNRDYSDRTIQTARWAREQIKRQTGTSEFSSLKPHLWYHHLINGYDHSMNGLRFDDNEQFVKDDSPFYEDDDLYG